VDRIIAASPGRDVLDVGCGTGISARLFAAAGCRVLETRYGLLPDMGATVRLPRIAGDRTTVQHQARQPGTGEEHAMRA
jgi:enoyl-CoA hydratase/carnithine racemase